MTKCLPYPNKKVQHFLFLLVEIVPKAQDGDAPVDVDQPLDEVFTVLSRLCVLLAGEIGYLRQAKFFDVLVQHCGDLGLRVGKILVELQKINNQL